MIRHEIWILRAVGMAEAAVAGRTGVSVRSVRRIAKEGPVDAPAAPQGQPVGRPSTTARWTNAITSWLETDRDLLGGEILHRLQAQGYGGGESAVHELIRRLRAPAVALPWSASRGSRGSSASMTSGRSRSAIPRAGSSASGSSPVG